MRVCNNCILPETFKSTEFNDEGVCNYCTSNTTVNKPTYVSDEEKSRLTREIDKIIDESRGKGKYDCVVGFSGGKDSAYLLWKLKNQYNLKVLAVTFDHGFMPDVTINNLIQIPKKLGIDVVSYNINTNFMERFFKYKFENYTKKTKAVFDSVCGDCSNIIEGNVMKIAAFLKIPLVFIGLSPEQSNRYFYEVPMNHLNEAWINDEMSEDYFTDFDRSYCWNPSTNEEKNLKVIFPFHVWKYSEAEIVKTLEELGLLTQSQSNPLNTRCKVLDTMCYIDLKKLGYDPFIAPFSDLVRTGKAPREKYYDLFYGPDYQLNMTHINEVINRLNLDMDAILNK